MRSFADLVPDLLSDVRDLPVADLETEALGFAMALVWASERPRDDAAAVIEALRSSDDEAAPAVLRLFSLLAPPVLRRAVGVPPAAEGRAAHVGSFVVSSAWRAVGEGVVVHVLWLERPDAHAQSFTLITASDDLGAALLGGGLSGAAPLDGLDARLREVTDALAVGELRSVEPDEVLARLRRGAATNAALMAAVSQPLALGADVVAHALAGDPEAVPSLDWSMDEGEDDDDRAAFLMRVLSRALEDGVEPRDPEALAAWRERFGELSGREQLRALGLRAPSGPPPRRPASGDDRRSKRKAARRARKRNR